MWNWYWSAADDGVMFTPENVSDHDDTLVLSKSLELQNLQCITNTPNATLLTV